MLELKFKRLTDTMTVPTKAHDTDACYDLYADIPNEEYQHPYLNQTFQVIETRSGKGVAIPPFSTVKIPTGFATNIPHGYFAAGFARSGVATKKGLRPANCTMIIDEPYTGEWMVPLHNDTPEFQVIEHGDKIAQFVLLPYPKVNLIEVDELDVTERGDGGFGSSGK